MDIKPPKATDLLNYRVCRIPDNYALARFGMTVRAAQTEGICIKCKKPKVFYEGLTESEQYVERLWYGKAALCYPCYTTFLDDEIEVDQP